MRLPHVLAIALFLLGGYAQANEKCRGVFIRHNGANPTTRDSVYVTPESQRIKYEQGGYTFYGTRWSGSRSYTKRFRNFFSSEFSFYAPVLEKLAKAAVSGEPTFVRFKKGWADPWRVDIFFVMADGGIIGGTFWNGNSGGMDQVDTILHFSEPCETLTKN